MGSTRARRTVAECGLKRGWRRVRLGDVVVRHVETCGNSDRELLGRFVGVDHLDSHDTRLARWGTIGNDALPPTFRYVFRSGMVLLPTRRPKLRKCALARFDGITGEKLLVLKPIDPAILLPELLRFLLSSDAVWANLDSVAIGSVTPHFRWRDLADFEFALPPIKEQRRMAAVLTAAEEALEAHDAARNSATDLLDSYAADRLACQTAAWPVVPLMEVLTLSQYGLSVPPMERGTYPILRMQNVVDGHVVEDDVRYVDLSDGDYEAYRLEDGDVLFNRTNSIDLVGRAGTYALAGDHVFASYLVRLRTDNKRILPGYLTTYLNSQPGRQQVRSYATRGVSQANVNASNLGKILVPLPSLIEQARIVAEIAASFGARAAIDERVRRTRELKRAYLTMCLDGER